MDIFPDSKNPSHPCMLLLNNFNVQNIFLDHLFVAILVNTKSILFVYAKHSTNIVGKVCLFAYSLVILVT